MVQPMAMPKGKVVRGARGIIVGVSGLTDMQQAFVRNFVVNGGDWTRAAEAAGYRTPVQAAYILRRNDAVMAAIEQANRHYVRGTLAQKAFGVINAILDDTDDAPQAKRLRLDAAKTILDRAGYVAPKAMEPERPSDNNDVGDMSLAELEAMIRESKARIEAMKLVGDAQGNTHDAPMIEAKPLEVLDVELSQSDSQGDSEPVEPPSPPAWLDGNAEPPAAEPAAGHTPPGEGAR